MVGGLSFLVNGSMCCGVTGDSLMVRIGPEALAQPHVQPMEFAGKRLSGFVLVDSEVFPTDAALAAWIQRGIDFAATLPAKKTGKGRKPK
jgi:hypothetical protein